MRFLYIIIFFIVLHTKGLSQQISAPPIAWGDIAFGESGGDFVATKSGNNFFSAEVSENTGNRTIDLNIYDSNGLLRSKRLFTDNCATCISTQTLPIKIVARVDNSVLVAFEANSFSTQLMKINSSGTILQSIFLNASLESTFISALQGGGFNILYKKSTGNFTLLNFNSTANLQWAFDLKNSIPTSLSITPSDGSVVTSGDSTKYIDATGKLLWKVKSQSTLSRIVDANTIYTIDNQGITAINTSNGTSKWRYILQGINHFQTSSDKGVIVVTSTNLIKIDAEGSFVWGKSGFGGKSVIISTNDVMAVINGNTASVYQSNGTLYWQKTFAYNKGNALQIYGGLDNGFFVTTRGVSPLKTSQNGTGFLYRILPVESGCNFEARITPDTKQTYCKTGSTTFSALQFGLDLSFGLPTTDYNLEWLKDNGVVANSQISFTTSEKGRYKVRSQQGNCSVVSSETEIFITGNSIPIITNDLIEQCKGGGVVSNLSSTNCSDVVLWSNVQIGTTVSVSPNVTTTYTALCQSSYQSNGIVLTCLSNASNEVTVKVLEASDIQIRDLNSKGVICGNDSLLLKGEVWNIFIPLKSSWFKDNVQFSSAEEVMIKEAGNYQLKVKDRRGCTNQTSVLAVSKSQIKSNIVGNSKFCDGTKNTIYANVTGGVGQYIYQWQSGGTVVSILKSLDVTNSGNYEVTVKDETGCTSKDNIQIEVHPKIVGLYKERTTIKGNLTYDFNKNTIIGGTPPYSFQLTSKANSGTAIPLVNDSFGPFNSNSTIYISVADAKNCSLKDSIKIDYIPCNVAVVLTGNETFCSSSKTTLTAQIDKGIPPFSYQWKMNDGFRGDAVKASFDVVETGLYQIVLSDSTKCIAYSNIKDVKKVGTDIVSKISITGDSTAYQPKTILLKASTGKDFTYQWQKDLKNIENATKENYEASETGKYSVLVRKEGCEVLSNQIQITILIPLGLSEVIDNIKINAYPNPTKDELAITLHHPKPTKVLCKIINASGKIIFENEVLNLQQEHFWKVNTSHWAAGMYVVNLQTDEGEIIRKIIKE